MSKKERPSPFQHAEFVLRSYEKNKKELQQLIGDYFFSTPVHDNTPVQTSQTSDPTGKTATRLVDDERIVHLRKAVDAVESAIFDLVDKPNGAAVFKLIKHIYWDDKPLDVAADEVGYSYMQTKRLRADFVNLIAFKLGWYE